MDFFGIGAALKGVTEIYFQSARRTGRTTALLESLREGDVVVTASATSARHLCDQVRARGLLEVGVVVSHPERAYELRENKGRRIVLEHSFIEKVYRQALERAAREIAHIQHAHKDAVDDRANDVEISPLARDAMQKWIR